ncbi:hypothetical protein ARALYDRAFT_893323 [Arabidopsis lyrata subsp. lyrata]|uniref:Uncharacterized protein n=1 Tax=Arabidopsis lyrata subsp. lyrata TaxID=81972 RepID=D7KVF8_ARALL|nr:hypothetical protein ARALYDRAFT_893323 [Arabidopsis lyrata subsp. lyrata]
MVGFVEIGFGFCLLIDEIGSSGLLDLPPFPNPWCLPRQEIQSRNKKDAPIVIWLVGGPGCSSELAMFYENGPFKISNKMSLSWNEYGLLSL